MSTSLILHPPGNDHDGHQDSNDKFDDDALMILMLMVINGDRKVPYLIISFHYIHLIIMLKLMIMMVLTMVMKSLMILVMLIVNDRAP